MRTGIVILGLVLALAGCGGEQAIETEPSPVPTEELTSEELAYSRQCGDTMSAAAQAAQDQGAVDAVDPAIATCATVDEFAAAVADHPEALETRDLEGFLRERCEQTDDPAVRDAAICQEIAGEAG